MASVFSVLTGLTHILDFAVAYAILLLLTITYIIKGKGEVKYLVMPLILSSALLASGFLVYEVMGGDSYKGISLVNEIIQGKFFEIKNPIEVSNVAFPLIIGALGIITSKSILINDVDRRIIFTLSIILIVLNIPLIPRDFLWRFNLMSAILVPLILGVFIGTIKSVRHSVLTVLLIASLLTPQFITAISVLKPSITTEEYYELKHIAVKAPSNIVFVVPNTKIRYWLETLTQNVVKKPKDAKSGSLTILVVEKFRPVPPWAKPFYEGEFVKAYLLFPRSP